MGMEGLGRVARETRMGDWRRLILEGGIEKWVVTNCKRWTNFSLMRTGSESKGQLSSATAITVPVPDEDDDEEEEEDDDDDEEDEEEAEGEMVDEEGEEEEEIE